MADYIVEPPRDLPLSKRVLSLRKEYEDAKVKLTAFKQENARYAPRKSLNAFYEAEYHIPAVREAEKELREQEIAAAAAGKTLPDRSAVLRPIEEKANEYRRMVSALEALVTRARKAFSEALSDELVSMGQKEAVKAMAARDAWEKAWKAMEAAKATLEKHAGHFTYCVTAGGMDVHPRHGHSQGDRLEYWELNKDGLLTWESSQELDYDQVPVKVPGLIEPNPNPPVAEEFNYNPKPRIHIAKDSGYGPLWEH